MIEDFQMAGMLADWRERLFGEFGEVGEGKWTKVFKMEDSEAIGTNGSGI